jgi:osmotically-inducible protein OsmY
MKKLFALLVLVALAVALYYWKYKPQQVQVPAAARDAVQDLGQKTKGALDSVGDKLRETKTAGEVKAALELNRDLAPYSISASSPESGVVTLEGAVPRDDLRAKAEAVASAVPDVRRVVNNIRVAPGEAPPAGEGRTLGENLDDKALVAKVHLAFSLNRELKGTDLDVRVYRKEVTLGGEVNSPSQKALAVKLAQETTGVAAVKDEIRVRGTAAVAAVPADRAQAVERALQANGHLASLGIKARTEGTAVVLEGNVRSAVEKDLAGALAREAAGGPVRNDIQIRP